MFSWFTAPSTRTFAVFLSLLAPQALAGGDHRFDHGRDADAFERERKDMLRALAVPIEHCLPRVDNVDRNSPIFHGCWDWHSAVHAAYSLYAIYRRTGDVRYRDFVDAQLRPELFDAELNYMRTTLFNNFAEISYGNSWFLALARERELATGATDLRPLAEHAAQRIRTALVALTPAQARSRVLNNNYNNLSWALIHLDLWGKFTGNAELVEFARSQAQTYLFDPTLDGTGTGTCPATNDRLAASNFFPPCLMRLAAVAKIFGAEQAAWVRERVPDSLYVEPLVIPNPLDISHNNGVNFSRAFTLWWIHQATNQDTVRVNAIRLLRDHLAQPVHWDLAAPYDVSHWVAQFAVRMLDASYERNLPGKSDRLPLQLALGDAWALGGPGPLPSPTGYVALLHQTLEKKQRGAIRLVNVGKASGTTANPATTANLLSGRLPYVLDLIEHWEDKSRRIEDPRLITLHTGFNVAFVRPTTPPAQFDALLAAQEVNARAAAADNWALLRADLDSILRKLRSAARDTRIVIGTYDNPYRSCVLPSGGPQTQALVDQYLEGGGDFALGLNDVIRQVAAKHDVAVAEAYGKLADAADWSADCFNPSELGHAKLAQAFVKADCARVGKWHGHTNKLCRNSKHGRDDDDDDDDD